MDGSIPRVAPSLSVVGRYALVCSYCLVCVSGDVNYYLIH
jgi:hypothetical protein